MNEDLKEQEVKLRDDVYGTIDEVGAALESGEEQKQLDAGKLVAPIVTRYTELLAKAGEAERERIERGLGRIVTDLRRTAGQLSQRASGNKAERAADAGGQPFILTRAPSPFLTKSSAPTGRRRNDNALTVGGEVEAWCGKCKESRTHRIVVIHEHRPYKVQCVHCKSQHGYRSEPTARGSAEPTDAPKRVVRTIDPEATKRRLEREKLSAELSAVAAADVRPFDPAGIYKSGQVLEHPKYGRGKIESITRGSLLVRFIDGLRPLSRQGWG